jgi:hypothetical protein
MDSFVWGNRLTGHYGNSERCTLTSPTYKASQDHPWIAFQHNFSTESLVDGGNFAYKPSTGSSWTVLTPSAGLLYNGTVSALGQPGWSGRKDDPSGWRQSVFTIDQVDRGGEFQVRWRFASDGSNNNYHGWLIDEVAGIGCNTLAAGDRPLQPGDSVIAALDFYPNPARGSGRVSYTLLKNCPVSINLYDITGALVRSLTATGFGKGAHSRKLDVSRLPGGVYFLRMVGQGDTRTAKVIIE